MATEELHGWSSHTTKAPMFAEGGIGTAYLAIAAMTCAVLIYGRFVDFFGSAAEIGRTILIFLTVSLTMSGGILCLARGMIGSAILSFAGLGWVFFYTYIYAMNSGIPHTLAAGGEFIGYSYFGLFALTIRDRTFGRLIYWFYIISCAYAIFYALASISVQFGIIDVSNGSRAVLSADDAGRTNRVLVAYLPLVYGMMQTLVLALRNFAIRHALFLSIYALDLYLAQSRTVALVIAIVFLAFVSVRNVDLVGKISAVIAAAGFVFSMVLIALPEYNPYYLSQDTSGSIRIMSVNTVSSLINYYWITGAGIAFGVEAYFPITGTIFFFPGDVGLIGMFFCYGIFGMVFYLFLMLCGFRIHRARGLAPYSSILKEALALTACVFGLYSLQSPQYDSGSSAAILAMACFALTVAKSHRSTRNGRRELTPRQSLNLRSDITV